MRHYSLFEGTTDVGITKMQHPPGLQSTAYPLELRLRADRQHDPSGAARNNTDDNEVWHVYYHETNCVCLEKISKTWNKKSLRKLFILH